MPLLGFAFLRESDLLRSERWRRRRKNDLLAWTGHSLGCQEPTRTERLLAFLPEGRQVLRRFWRQPRHSGTSSLQQNGCKHICIQALGSLLSLREGGCMTGLWGTPAALPKGTLVTLPSRCCKLRFRKTHSSGPPCPPHTKVAMLLTGSWNYGGHPRRVEPTFPRADSHGLSSTS